MVEDFGPAVLRFEGDKTAISLAVELSLESRVFWVEQHWKILKLTCV